jgi:hypothetical protein
VQHISNSAVPSKINVIAEQWALSFFQTFEDVGQNDSQGSSGQRMETSFIIALLKANLDSTHLQSGSRKLAYLERLKATFPETSADILREVARILEDREARYNLTDLWIVSLLATLYGEHVNGVEVRMASLDKLQLLADTVHDMLEIILDVIPAYDYLEAANYKAGSKLCAAVQSGAYVLLPRCLKNHDSLDAISSLLAVVPGSLMREGIPVKGFYFEEHHVDEEVIDVRSAGRIPQDWSVDGEIHYHYQEIEGRDGYRFWTTEAGYRLNLGALIEAILRLHAVAKYNPLLGDQPWAMAAPSSYGITRFCKSHLHDLYQLGRSSTGPKSGRRVQESSGCLQRRRSSRGTGLCRTICL